MKQKILLFIILISINYKLNAQIKLLSNIITQDASSVYPTHIDSLGKGGLMTLPDLTTRNAIPAKRRKQGMMVYVQANDSLYKLTTSDVSLNTGWVAIGLLSQQKLTDSLNSRLKATDTLSLSARIDLKANAGTISDVTTLLADKLNITDTSLLLQKADTASLSNRINLKANTTDFNSLSTTVGTKFKTTDTSYLLQKADTASLSNRINLKLDANKIGAKNGVASLNAAGVIPSDQIPPISFSSVDVVNSQAEMLSFTNGMGLPTDRLVGSIVVRIDSSKNFVLARQPASVRANWTELLTPAPPVQSVNGHLGTVSITPLDLHLDSVDNTRDIDKPVSTLTLTALNLKLKITDTSYLLQKADTIRLSNRIVSSVASITAETTRATNAETTLTNKVNSNTSSITSNTSSISTLNTNVSANTSSITTLNTKINSNTASITANTLDILLRATISSPSFTGTPTAATAIAGTNTTQLATTEFVRTAVTSITGLSNTNLSGNAGITDANLATISTGGKVSNSATSATASNTSNTIVARDGIGNFSANSITASLNGTALNATNIAGGAAGAIPYQTANNTTGLLAAGTNGQFLQLSSGLPSWQTLSTSVNASSITGTVALLNGGTGQTSLAGIQSILGLTGVNVAIGESAGATTQGPGSVAIGKLSGMSTQGSNSVAIGNQAGKTTQGGLSIAIGPLAGQSNQGANSVAMGYLAGNNYQGANSVALGAGAASGGNSTAVGYYASSGTYSSTALGGYASAGYANSTAIGYQASTSAPNTIQLGADGVSVAGSTAVTDVKTSGTLTAGTVTYPNTQGTNGQLLTTTGSGTLTWTSNVVPYTGANRSVNLGAYDLAVNGLTIGLGIGAIATNTVLGNGALSNSSNTGANNIAMGYNALKLNTTGLSNTAIGKSSLQTNTTGNHNTAIGNMANVGASNLENATAIGDSAIVSTSNSIQLGNINVTNVRTSGTLTANAVTYPNTHGTTGQLLTTTGTGTLTWTTATNTLVPYTGAIQAVNLGAYDLTVNGITVGTGTVSGTSSPNYNTAFGYNVLTSNTTGTNNVANGYGALKLNTSGVNNLAFGWNTLTNNTTGSNNGASGFNSLAANTSGWYNTSNGGNALALNTTGYYNTGIGRKALYNNTIGNHNTAIGNMANVSVNNLENATAIGDSAIVTASNTIQLGNINVTNVKTNGTLTAGAITYPNLHGISGQLLTTTGSGTLTWTTPYAPADASTTSKGIIQLAGDLTGTALSPTVNSVGGVNSSTIATFDTRITSATNSLTSNTASINTLNTNVSSNTSSITSLSTSILASTITGTVSVTNGGTGQTSIAGIRTALGLSGTQVTIGSNAASISPTSFAVAIGYTAGQNNQAIETVSVGTGAGRDAQGSHSVALGSNAGITNQGSESVAIGYQAGSTSQSNASIAVGYASGNNSQGANAVAIGAGSGNNAQGSASVALGTSAGNSSQGNSAVAIGYNAGRLSQGIYSVALGINAAEYTQGMSSVALGYAAGQDHQNTNSVALGFAAGQYSQNQNAVAIGVNAGQNSQGLNSVAIGQSAAQNNQGSNSVAIGVASNSTANTATALGANSAANYTNSTAIGYQATTTADNTIQLGNSSVSNVNTSGAINAKSFYLNASNAITAAANTTIDLSLSNIFKVSLGTSISTLNLTNAKPGTYIIEFIQGGTNNVSFPGAWRWSTGIVPIITQTANKIDLVTLVYDGSTYFASTVQNF